MVQSELLCTHDTSHPASILSSGALILFVIKSCNIRHQTQFNYVELMYAFEGSEFRSGRYSRRETYTYSESGYAPAEVTFLCFPFG